MLVNVDFSALEWRVALVLSKDKTGIQEVLDGIDQHSDNQAKFGLPSRVKAKIFLFKLIYGATAFGYAQDPDFLEISNKKEFWQDVIDKFYAKYSGIKKWHDAIMLEAKCTGSLFTPSGVEYKFLPIQSKYGVKWPDTQIKNYVVQGFGAEIVKLARIMLYRRLIAYRNDGILLVNTVHDSLMVDCVAKHVPFVVQTIKEVLAGLPAVVSKTYGMDYCLPTGGDIETGISWATLKEYHETV